VKGKLALDFLMDPIPSREVKQLSIPCHVITRTA
jgi:hypothetical protein